MEFGSVSRGRLLSLSDSGEARVILLDGRSITAQCNADGNLPTCWEPGTTVEVSRSTTAGSSSSLWTLERIYLQGWIGVNSRHTVGTVVEAVQSGQIDPLAGYTTLSRSVEAFGGIFDIAIGGGTLSDAYIDVRNATRLDGEVVRYPDVVLNGAGKHLDHLRNAVEAGNRGIVIFAVNRPHGGFFEPGGDLDPEYTAHLEDVAADGVEIIAVRIRHAPNSAVVGPWAIQSFDDEVPAASSVISERGILSRQ